ncbi:hypothetical protein ARAM_004229 [Aspergillus rambellii]|uniref:Thioredoxin-like protein n=1 Tax=Aspergillus rambellii TaxID=308745 RepID=A0A0F8U2C6_9EURO|nr:hypothetical protein ARAM_004229 [Aspergillus rambellii]
MVFRFVTTPSTRAYNILKAASAAAAAADSPAPGERGEFQLEITTAAPTPDQLRSILDFVNVAGNLATGGDAGGAGGKYEVGRIVSGARDAEDALRRFKEDAGRFVRPITVDWTNGQAVVGDNESEILKMVRRANE